MSGSHAPNTVIANLYGRGPTGKARPLRVTEEGGLTVTPPAPVTVIDWDAPIVVPVLTPLVAWAPYADDSAMLIVGMKVADDAADGATFIVESSEDGVTPSISGHLEFPLTAGQHDVWESPNPLIRRYYRLAVQPTGAGPTKIQFIFRRVPR